MEHSSASLEATHLRSAPTEIAARLFMVGCPRSGTTLMQSLLCAHPQVFSVPESHLYTHLTSRNPILRRLGIARFDAPEVFAKLTPSLGLPTVKARGLTVRYYLRHFAHLLDHATLGADKIVWLEKTPRHLYYLPEIERALPEAKFIHVLRDGADVVASLYEVTQQYPEVWGGARSVDACIDRWIKDVGLSRSYQGKPNHLLVRYEALTADPETCLREIFTFVGVPFVPEVLSDYGRASQRVIAPGEAWKASVRGGIQNTSKRKFSRLFTPTNQAYILGRVRSLSSRSR